MKPRNTNQVSEANATRYIPLTVLKPFGYTGMPTLELSSLTIDESIRDLINVAARFKTPPRVVCSVLRKKVLSYGATNVTISFKEARDIFAKDLDTDIITRMENPPHYKAEYTVNHRTFISYIES